MEYDEDIIAALSKAVSMRQEQTLEVDYHKFIVDITKDFAEPEPIVSQGDRILVSRGNLCTITGKAKSYKTFLVSAIVAAFLEDETLSLSGPGGRCLYIDTEQAVSHVNKVQRRIYRLCGWNFDKPSDDLITLSLRELSVKNRLKTTITAIEDSNPDLVIIDGIRDLINDFNSIEESLRVVGIFMALSTQQNCAIINVLHQNKADENARGHLGSEICNKSETVLQVKKKDGIAVVNPVYSRNRDIEEFSFRIDETGLPVPCDCPKVEKKRQDVEDLMKKVMFGSSEWKKKDLIDSIMRANKKGDKTARRAIDSALEMGIIKKNEAEIYYLAELWETGDLPY
ncbi:MAG: AAA family ATPase [Bacteroidales bacterium]|nr:AAA family ATPase [Bacteroidales bacterium]